MPDTSSSIRNAYNEWAEIYDTNDNPTRDLNIRMLRGESFPFKGKSVLEIGCGTGLNTEYLARQAKQVTGMDFSEGMLAKARHRVTNSNVRFVSGDATRKWSFGAESFDFVVANLILEHIRDLTHVFSETFRVLRPGGMFYMAELHPYKQLRQSQAKYMSSETGEEILVDAFLHSTSEYINEGLNLGFVLRQMREWQDSSDDIPRLLTLRFEKKREDG